MPVDGRPSRSGGSSSTRNLRSISMAQRYRRRGTSLAMSPSASPPACAAATAATRGAVLELGGVRRDLRVRPLVMGILNRTRDSFFDGGACLELDAVLARAERLPADGGANLHLRGGPGGGGPHAP